MVWHWFNVSTLYPTSTLFPHPTITKPNLKLLMFFCSLHSVQLHRRRHHHGIYIASTRVTTVDITPSDDESEWSRVRCHASSLLSSRTPIFSPSVLLPLFFRQRFYKCTNAHIMLLQHKYILMCTRVKQIL